MTFTYSRTIRFADTDAAGVVYFANYLSICHEAYEEGLLDSGIELHRFFADEGIVIPVSHTDADFLRPLECGAKIEVELAGERVKESEFAIHYKVFLPGPPRKLAARATTRHVCIDAASRRRVALPGKMSSWIG